MTAGVIDLWQWDLDDPAMADPAVLTPEERARASRFVVPDAERRYIAGRSALRRRLAEICGIPAAELVLATGPNGKPFLQAGPHFNLSHSGATALFAVADFPVGVDVEALRTVEGGIATAVFTPAELAHLAKLTPAERGQAFFRGWTRKEAVVKAKGGTIADLQAVTVLPEARLAGWQVTDVPMPARHCAALAAPSRGWVVRRHD